MEHIAEGGGRLQSEIRRRDAIPNGLTAFRDEDVLIAKITPCFENQKGWLAHGLSSGVGFGSTELHVVRTGPRVLPRIVYAHTQSLRFRRLGERFMTGSAGQQRVSADFLRGYRIWLPCLAAQRRIASLDEQLEATLRSTDALIAAKREQKRGLMQQLLTGKVRFPGFTEPWKTVPLKSMITLDSPGAWGDAPTHADPGVVVLRSTNITDDGRIDLTSTVNRSLEPRKRAALSIRSGDILLERSGGTDTRPVGRVAFARMDIDACYSNFLQRLRPDRAAVSPFFLFLQLMQLHASGATNRLQAQTTGIRNLMYRAYLECSLPLPKLEEQVRICDALDAATSEIELLVNQREAFASQRRGLMERLLSGEIDIPSSDTSAA